MWHTGRNEQTEMLLPFPTQATYVRFLIELHLQFAVIIAKAYN